MERFNEGVSFSFLVYRGTIFINTRQEQATSLGGFDLIGFSFDAADELI